MIKKYLYLILLMIYGCGFNPIYVNQNENNFEFSEIILKGDSALNDRLVKSIDLKEDELNPILNKIIIWFIIDLRYANEVNILNIAIGKPFQNKGHGFKMVYNYLKILPQNWTVLLEVKKNNYKALKIYSKLNFKKLYIRKAYYNDGADAVNMSLVKWLFLYGLV